MVYSLEKECFFSAFNISIYLKSKNNDSKLFNYVNKYLDFDNLKKFKLENFIICYKLLCVVCYQYKETILINFCNIFINVYRKLLMEHNKDITIPECNIVELDLNTNIIEYENILNHINT